MSGPSRWAKGLVRVGMTTVAGKLAGGKLNAVTVKAKNIGAEIAGRQEHRHRREQQVRRAGPGSRSPGS